ncbi:MAG: cyclic nucleotide-binding domain-containing protein [Nitrospiraceae bacterium]|nr:cyclic nucleotide-binding domain-containing protein [Nitrospiraceae bacterium]
MSTVHLLQDTNDRSVPARRHNSYKAKGTIRESSVCHESLAVCRKGRWILGPGEGRTVLTSPKKQIIFSQGEAAGSVFYIQAGEVKLTVVSPQGKEAVVAILERGSFWGNPASPDRPLGWLRRPSWKTPVSCASTKRS